MSRYLGSIEAKLESAIEHNRVLIQENAALEARVRALEAGIRDLVENGTVNISAEKALRALLAPAPRSHDDYSPIGSSAPGTPAPDEHLTSTDDEEVRRGKARTE